MSPRSTTIAVTAICVLLLTSLSPTSAEANQVDWTVTSYTANNGPSVFSGGFRYDNLTNTVSNIDLSIVVFGPPFPINTFAPDTVLSVVPSQINWQDSVTGVIMVFDTFGRPLGSPFDGEFYVFQMFGNQGFQGTGSIQAQLVPPTQTPEPATVTLMGASGLRVITESGV